jgi:hypothetical protein
MTCAVQAEHLERVSTRLSALILTFCRERLASQGSFHMFELTSWIADYLAVAPDSPGRILRDLRSKGSLSYVVVNRSQSLYQLIAVEDHDAGLRHA